MENLWHGIHLLSLVLTSIESCEKITFQGLKICEKVRAKLIGTGFEHFYDANSAKVLNVSMLSNLLVQLYDTDSGLFIFGRHRLYFGLEDMYLITGLPIDGEPF